MNENHAKLCPSPEWAAYLHRDVLPALTEGLALGPRMFEIGPGPGASTEWLREQVEELVAVEIDEATVDALRERFAGTNVEVVHGDATALPFEDDSFDGAGTFTMLHHVPTAAMQNLLLAEILRVLKPGATLVCSDSLPSSELHALPRRRHLQPGRPGDPHHATYDGRVRCDHGERRLRLHLSCPEA